MTASRPFYYISSAFTSIILSLVCIRLVTSSTQPSNVALKVGSSTTLQCSPGVSSNYVQWSFVVTGSNSSVIISGWNNGVCTQSSSYPQYQFNSTNTAQVQCDLIINNVTPSQAGWYQCAAVISGGTYNYNAQVTVVYSDPVCSQNVTTDVAVNDVISMKCVVSYSSEGVNATMSWSGCSYQTLQNTTIVNGNNITTESEIAVVAQQQQYLQTCTCYTTTGYPPPVPPSLIGGTPSNSIVRFSSEWNSSANILVQYCPNSVTMNLPSDTIPINTTITCQANGYPPPTVYVLTVLYSGDNQARVINGSSVWLGDEGEYYISCNATNNITSAQHGSYSCTNQSQTYRYNVSSLAILDTETTASQFTTGESATSTWLSTTGFSSNPPGIGPNETMSYSTTPPSPPPTPEPTPAPTPPLPIPIIIGVCVGVGVPLIAAIVLLVLYFVKGSPLYHFRCCERRVKTARPRPQEDQNGRGSHAGFQMNQTSPNQTTRSPSRYQEDSPRYPPEVQMGGYDQQTVVYAELQQPQPQVVNLAGSRQPVKFQTDNSNDYAHVKIA